MIGAMARSSVRLVCPACGAALRRRAGIATCPAGHAIPGRDGILDLATAIPDGSTAGIFDGPYGALYDYGIKHPRAASAVGRLLWGSDLSAMYRLMDRGTDLPEGKVVLDVPVGGAPVLQRAAQLRCDYVGVDLSWRMLEHAREVAQSRGFESATLLRADASSLPLRDRTVDRVLCFNGLHVIPDKAAVLADLARVLRPGGELWGSVIVSPESLLLRVARPWTATTNRLFKPASAVQLRAFAKAAGFERWTQRVNGAMLTFRARRGA
jgi:ubiquinone/menaquinone biosynthesis C-methylase UbiE